MDLSLFESKIYSQNGEDGITKIREINYDKICFKKKKTT